MSFIPSAQTTYNFPEHTLEQQKNHTVYQDLSSAAQAPSHNYYGGWNNENQQPQYGYQLPGARDFPDMSSHNVFYASTQQDPSEPVQQPATTLDQEIDMRAFYNGYGIIPLHNPNDASRQYQMQPVMNPPSILDHAGVYPAHAKSNIGPMRRCSKSNRDTELAERGRTRSDRSQLPSEEEAKVILDLDLMENDVINLENLIRRIKYELLARRIKQKTFAKYVLGRSQGTFSDLMRFTKSWDQLSSAGRKPYEQIYEWIQSPPDEKDALAMKEKVTVKQVAKPVVEAADKPKRYRTKFSHEQQDALEAQFAQAPLSNGSELKDLAQRLGLEEKVVANFFANARRKLRNQ